MARYDGWAPAKIEDKALRRGFVQVPHQVFFDRELTDRAVRVYGALLWHCWRTDDDEDGEGLVPPQKELGEQLGLHINLVNRAFKELRERGYIEVKRVGLGKPNEIIIKRLK